MYYGAIYHIIKEHTFTGSGNLSLFVLAACNDGRTFQVCSTNLVSKDELYLKRLRIPINNTHIYVIGDYVL